MNPAADVPSPEKMNPVLQTGPTKESMKAPEGYMTSPDYIANTVEFNGYIYADSDTKHLWSLSKGETVTTNHFIRSGNCMWYTAT